MKAAIDTLDTMIVQRPSYKQNLCLDKGYDFPTPRPADVSGRIRDKCHIKKSLNMLMTIDLVKQYVCPWFYYRAKEFL